MSDFVYFSFFGVQAAGALSIKIGKIFWFFFFCIGSHVFLVLDVSNLIQICRKKTEGFIESKGCKLHAISFFH